MVFEIPNAKNGFPKSQPTFYLNRRGSKLISSIAVLINLSVPHNCDQELKLFNGLSDHALDAQSGCLVKLRQLPRRISDAAPGWILNNMRKLGLNSPIKNRRVRRTLRNPVSTTRHENNPGRSVAQQKLNSATNQVEDQTGNHSPECLASLERTVGGLFCNSPNLLPSERAVKIEWIETIEQVKEFVPTAPSLPLYVSNILLDKFLTWDDKCNIEILELPWVSKYVARIFCMARDLAGGIENEDIQNLLRRIDEVSEQNQGVSIILNNVADEIKSGRYTEEDFMRDAKLERGIVLDDVTVNKFVIWIPNLNVEGISKKLIMGMVNEFIMKTVHADPDDPLINLKVCMYILEMFDTNDLPKGLAKLPDPDIDSPSNPITALIRRALDEAVGKFAPYERILLDYISSVGKRREMYGNVMSKWIRATRRPKYCSCPLGHAKHRMNGLCLARRKPLC